MQTHTTSREFNQNPSAVKKSANEGPVIITERGKAAYVILSYGEYRQLTEGHKSVLDSLHMPGVENINFDPQRDLSTARDVEF